MRYLVAGGLGFMGSELCRQLLANDEATHIYCVDDNSKGYGTANIADFMNDDRFEWINIDLSKPSEDDMWLLEKVINDVQHVINFAAKIGGIGYFNKIPATILRDNNLINTTLMDLIVEEEYQNSWITNKKTGTRLLGQGYPNDKYDVHWKKKIHYTCISSSMVFESATKFPSKESDLATTILPITSYGFSKLSAEYYCKAYAAQYGLEYTIIRPFNAVGPEKPDPNFVGFSHVIPDLILKIYNGQGTKEKPLEILGDGNQVRHYTDVREIAGAIRYILKYQNLRLNEDYNVAIEKGHSVRDVADLIWYYMRGPKHALHLKNIDGFAHDVQFRSPDVTKFKLAGWQARNTLEDIMPEIIDSVLKLIKESHEVKT